jgi:SAM-dependent methyltransferase
MRRMRDRWRKAQEYELAFWRKHQASLPDHSGEMPRDLEYMVDEIGEGNAVLEVGCGPMGTIYFAPGLLRIGIDPLARSYVQSLDFPLRGVHLVQSVGEAMPFRDGLFDVVICANVLDHVDQPEPTLREIRRVLKPDGVLILVMHILPRWLMPARHVLNRIDTGHPHHLTRASVRRMAEECGLVETESNTEPPGVGWYSVKAALGNVVMRSLRMKCRPNGAAR